MSNGTEAALLLRVVGGLVASGLPDNTIGAISPYRSQVLICGHPARHMSDLYTLVCSILCHVYAVTNLSPLTFLAQQNLASCMGFVRIAWISKQFCGLVVCC